MSIFYMPTKVFDEKDAVIKNAGVLKAFGKKALIVTGSSSAMKNGAYNDVVEALESQGISHVLFNEIEENPSTDTIMRARDFGLSVNVDFVVGVGGGSPMDASKAIALMIKHKDASKDYMYDPSQPSDTIPVVCVPTTCGTGSEVTAVSVLTVPEKDTKISIKHKIFPKVSFIDGKYLKSAPAHVLNNTAIDALTHMYESYLNVNSTVYSEMCVDAGLRSWAKNLDIIKGERVPTDDDYQNLMRASMMAGMAIAQDGTALPHGFSYGLTTRKHVPHGKAVGYFTAGYLACADQKDREYLLKTAGFTSLEDFQEVLYKACGPVDVDEDFLMTLVEEMSVNTAKLKAVPYHVGRDELVKIALYTKKSGY